MKLHLCEGMECVETVLSHAGATLERRGRSSGNERCCRISTLKGNHGSAEPNLEPLGPGWMPKYTYITVYVFMSPGCCVTGLLGFKRQGQQVAPDTPSLLQSAVMLLGIKPPIYTRNFLLSHVHSFNFPPDPLRHCRSK
jgi:hypothetical protein